MIKFNKNFTLSALCAIVLVFAACTEDEPEDTTEKYLDFSAMQTLYNSGNVNEVKKTCYSLGYGKIKDTSTYQNHVTVYRKYTGDKYYLLCLYTIKDSIYQMKQYIVNKDIHGTFTAFKSWLDTLESNSYVTYKNASIVSDYIEDSPAEYPQYFLLNAALKNLTATQADYIGTYYFDDINKRSISLLYETNRIDKNNYGVNLQNFASKVMNITIEGPSVVSKD